LQEDHQSISLPLPSIPRHRALDMCSATRNFAHQARITAIDALLNPGFSPSFQHRTHLVPKSTRTHKLVERIFSVLRTLVRTKYKRSKHVFPVTYIALTFRRVWSRLLHPLAQSLIGSPGTLVQRYPRRLIFRPTLPSASHFSGTLVTRYLHRFLEKSRKSPIWLQLLGNVIQDKYSRFE